MAITPTPSLPQTPKSGKTTITSTYASAATSIYTGGSNGSKIVAVTASSCDTSNRDVMLGIANGGTFYPLGTATVTALAGQASSVVAVNLLDPTIICGLPVDNDGQVYLLLTSSLDVLQAKSLTTVTSSLNLYINSIGADW